MQAKLKYMYAISDKTYSATRYGPPYWAYEKEVSLQQHRFHCTICTAALWLARFSV